MTLGGSPVSSPCPSRDRLLLLPFDVERLRRLAVASAPLMLLAALGIAVSPGLHHFSVRSSALSWAPGGEAIIRVDTLSSVLLPFVAGLCLLTVAVTRARRSTRGGLRRTALPPSSARVLSDRERCGASAPSVASVWRFCPRSRTRRISPAPHRRRLSGVLDTPVWFWRRASRPPRRPEHSRDAGLWLI